MSEIKAKTLFDHLQHVTAVQSPTYWDDLSRDDRRTWSNYMILRFLSMNPNWTELISQLQPVIHELKPEYLYRLLINIIPKGKTYSKYVKGKDTEKYEGWLVDLVAKDFMCSTYTAVDYLNILYGTKEGKDAILFLCQKYGTDPKKIKQLKLDK